MRPLLLVQVPNVEETQFFDPINKTLVISQGNRILSGNARIFAESCGWLLLFVDLTIWLLNPRTGVMKALPELDQGFIPLAAAYSHSDNRVVVLTNQYSGVIEVRVLYREKAWKAFKLIHNFTSPPRALLLHGDNLWLIDKTDRVHMLCWENYTALVLDPNLYSGCSPYSLFLHNHQIYLVSYSLNWKFSVWNIYRSNDSQQLLLQTASFLDPLVLNPQSVDIYVTTQHPGYVVFREDMYPEPRIYLGDVGKLAPYYLQTLGTPDGAWFSVGGNESSVFRWCQASQSNCPCKLCWIMEEQKKVKDDSQVQF